MADEDDEIDELWSSSVSKDSITSKKSKSPALVVHHKNKTPYNAFETKDKLLGFVVRCLSTRVHYNFFYHHVLTIALNSPDDDQQATIVATDGTSSQGPLPETKAVVGGFSIIEVSTRDEALALAARIAKSCRCAQEVREIMYDPES